MPHDNDLALTTAYPMLASRVFDTPLLIAQPKLDVILAALAPRIGVAAPGGKEGFDGLAAAEHKQSLIVAEAKAAGLSVERADGGYHIVGDRVAVVQVVGTLVHRGGWMEAMSGLQSYQMAQSQLASALNDRHVERIVMEYDTPGGEAAGAFDFADYIYEARKHKHITAVVNEMSASGGYLLASAAHEIVVPRTGRVGSIGVVYAHVDRSKAIDKAGMAVTYIYAGDKKIDGNPTQPLPERVRAEMQVEIDNTYALFTETVARNTGMSVKAVRDTQAGMYTGRAAVDLGLAKRVNTFTNELQIAVSRSGARSASISLPSQEVSMSADEKKAGEMTHTAAQVAAARDEGKAEGLKAGATAERERVKTIVTHADAAGRTDLATHLAFETDMSAEAATALLGKSPKVSVADPKGKTALEQAMEAAGSPNIVNTGTTEAAPKDGSWDHTIKKFGG